MYGPNCIVIVNNCLIERTFFSSIINHLVHHNRHSLEEVSLCEWPDTHRITSFRTGFNFIERVCVVYSAECHSAHNNRPSSAVCIVICPNNQLAYYLAFRVKQLLIGRWWGIYTRSKAAIHSWISLKTMPRLLLPGMSLLTPCPIVPDSFWTNVAI